MMRLLAIIAALTMAAPAAAEIADATLLGVEASEDRAVFSYRTRFSDSPSILGESTLAGFCFGAYHAKAEGYEAMDASGALAICETEDVDGVAVSQCNITLDMLREVPTPDYEGLVDGTIAGCAAGRPAQIDLGGFY